MNQKDKNRLNFTDKKVSAKTPITEDILEKRLREEIDRVKSDVITNYVTVLGIFASIVTFLLVEIQILKNICDFMRLLGFSAFILGGLISFVFLLLFSINLIEFRLRNTFLITILTTVVLSLFTLSYLSVKNSPDEYTCKVANLNEEFGNLKLQIQKKYEGQIDSLDTRLKKLENNFPKK